MKTLTWGAFVAAAMTIAIIAGPAYAVRLCYTFEGDSGATVADKLTGDGSQNGILLGEASIQSMTSDPPGYAAWGTRSGLFETPAFPGWNQIEIPGSTALGENFSLAIYANLDFNQITKGLMRLFSSYRGSSGLLASEIVLDMDPYGADVAELGIEAAVNRVYVWTAAPPTGIANPGYHHYAMTVDGTTFGKTVSVYFDGSLVATGEVGPGYSNSANLRIGEDATTAYGAYCEQLVGNVDEVLVINQTLAPTQIASLAGGSKVSDVVTPGAGEYAVYYDFEGDSGRTITDKFTADGQQDGIVYNNVVVDTATSSAKLGSGSATLGPMERFSQINTGVKGTDLGSEFTLSAVVNVDGDGYSTGNLARLFSNYYGRGGGVTVPYLVMEFEPDASSYGGSLYLTLPDGTLVSATTPFSYGEDHTLTATYDSDTVKLYIDGVEVASKSVFPGGVVNLGNYTLRIGEDLEASVGQQLRGDLDDVVIDNVALSAAQVLDLHARGAAAFYGIVEQRIPGDATGEGIVDEDDAAVLAGNWGMSGAEWEDGDFNDDGIVNAADASILAANWGYVASEARGASVPEPSAIVLLLGLPLVLVFHRRR